MDYKQKEILQKFASHKVDLNLYDKIDGALDKVDSKRRNIQSQIEKLATQLGSIGSEYSRVASMATDALKKAEDLGADELIRLFKARRDEAIDLSGVVSEAEMKIKVVVDKI